MLEWCRTWVRTVRQWSGVTEELEAEVGQLHRSALSSIFFAMVMDRLKKWVRQDSTLFADDIVICNESREQLEGNL